MYTLNIMQSEFATLLLHTHTSTHMQDIVISIMLVVVFVVSGLVQTVYAAKWKDAPSSCIVSRTYCRDQNWWKVTSAAAVSQ